MNTKCEWYHCPTRRSAAWGHGSGIISALRLLYHKSKRAAFVRGLAVRGTAVPPFDGKMFTRGKSLIFQSGNVAPTRSTAPPWGYYTMNAQREWYNCPSRRSAAWGHEASIISALQISYHTFPVWNRKNSANSREIELLNCSQMCYDIYYL